MAEHTALARIRELDDERAKIFDDAKSEALEKAHRAIEALNALGLNYSITDRVEKSAKKKSARGETRGQVKDAECPICGFKTDKPHDARAHRGQEKKKAFTAAELKQKGLVKV